jgi:hypothetical protein
MSGSISTARRKATIASYKVSLPSACELRFLKCNTDVAVPEIKISLEYNRLAKLSERLFVVASRAVHQSPVKRDEMARRTFSRTFGGPLSELRSHTKRGRGGTVRSAKSPSVEALAVAALAMPTMWRNGCARSSRRSKRWPAPRWSSFRFEQVRRILAFANSTPSNCL